MEQPETYKIIKPFLAHLKLKDENWRMLNIHGSKYGDTLPDKLLIHPDYSPKLAEFKVVNEYGKVKLHGNQPKDWKIYIPGGLKFWVICAKDLRGVENYFMRERLYNKLFEPPNCEFLLSPTMHKYLWS